MLMWETDHRPLLQTPLYRGAPAAGVHAIEDLWMHQLGREALGSAMWPDRGVVDPAAPALGGCGRVNEREKSTTVVRGAPLLVLHLLRFQYSAELQRVIKLPTRVSFETVFPPLCGDKPYDLHAVLVHEGVRPASDRADAGHYTAFVRAQDAH